MSPTRSCILLPWAAVVLCYGCGSKHEPSDLGEPGPSDLGTATGCARDELVGTSCGSSSAVIINPEDDRLPLEDECDIFLGSISFSDTLNSDLSMLMGVREVRGDLTMFRTDLLASLRGLDDLEEVDGNLMLRETARLESLDSLRQLRQVGGVLNLSSLRGLLNLDGLSELECVGSLRLDLPERITTLAALDRLQVVHGSIHIKAPGVAMDELLEFSDRFETTARITLNGETIQEGS
mgnify:CR=1 FL=1